MQFIEQLIKDYPFEIKWSIIGIVIVNLLIFALMILAGNFMGLFFNLLRFLIADIIMVPVVAFFIYLSRQ